MSEIRTVTCFDEARTPSIRATQSHRPATPRYLPPQQQESSNAWCTNLRPPPSSSSWERRGSLEGWIEIP
jgi:hypothetical protein